MPILGIIASALAPTISKPLGTWSTSGSQNPYGNWTYFQGMGTGFPAANVFQLTGSYNSNYSVNGNTYTISNGGSSWTSRTSYPTPIFQTSMVAFDSKMFVLGGNGTGGSAAGPTTANVYYMTTSLNSWTAGTSMPAAGGWQSGATPNFILAFQNPATTYRGTGTSAWTQVASIPEYPPVILLGKSYSVKSDGTIWVSTNDGSSWTNTNIVTPTGTGPRFAVAAGQGSTVSSSIYMWFNTFTSPIGYYFNGKTFTVTTDYGLEYSAGSGSQVYAIGFNGTQLTAVYTASPYKYTTISA